MTWVRPFPVKWALSTPERGPMTQRGSMTLAWSSWDRSLRGTRSHTSWPELPSEVSSFLMASLISFDEQPGRSPWYHSWTLRSWSNWSSWSTSAWSLLIEFSLISKIPCSSELITVISSSDEACSPVTHLLIVELRWSWRRLSLNTCWRWFWRSLLRLMKPLIPE